MSERKFFIFRLYFTAAVAVAIWSLLAWDHYHGGVPSHHILANKDLPAFSNGWGALLLPLLTWYLLYRIQKRAFSENAGNSEAPHFLLPALYGFLGALLFGILLSTFFTMGDVDLPGYMLIGLLVLAFFCPIYRAEYLLGFVMGMTFTFGAVLPTGIGLILSFIGLVLYLYIRTAFQYVGSKLTALASQGNR
jgi:hypothetical protein